MMIVMMQCCAVCVAVDVMMWCGVRCCVCCSGCDGVVWCAVCVEGEMSHLVSGIACEHEHHCPQYEHTT